MSSIKVLLAEDHPLLRKLLVEHLRNEPDIQVVGDAGDGREAVRLAERARPDVALLDYDMPLLSGGEAARLIRERCPQTLIVMLSDLSSTQLPWIDQWLKKDMVEHIGATVRQLVRQRSNAHSASVLMNWVDLTKGQQNALRILVTENLSNKEIAVRLSRIERAHVSESAVKKRLELIMDKWNVDPRTRGRLIQVAQARLRSGGV